MSPAAAINGHLSGLILIAEDERDLASTLEHDVMREGYAAPVASNRAEAFARAAVETLRGVGLRFAERPEDATP